MLRRTALYALCLGLSSLVAGEAGAQQFKLALLPPPVEKAAKPIHRAMRRSHKLVAHRPVRRQFYARRQSRSQAGLQALAVRSSKLPAKTYVSVGQLLMSRGKLDPDLHRMAMRLGTAIANSRPPQVVSQPIVALRLPQAAPRPVEDLVALANPSHWTLGNAKDSPLVDVYKNPGLSGAVVLRAGSMLALQPGVTITGVKTIPQKKFTPVLDWNMLAAYLGLLRDDEVVVEYKTPAGKVGTAQVPVNKNYQPPSPIESIALNPPAKAFEPLTDLAMLGSKPRANLAKDAMVTDLRSQNAGALEAKRAFAGAVAPKTRTQTILSTQRTNEDALLRDPGVQGQGPLNRIQSEMGEGKGAIVKQAPAESSMFAGCAIVGIRTLEQTAYKPVRTWADIVEFTKSLPDDEVMVKYREPGGAVKECKVQLYHPRITLRDDML